MFIAVSHSGGVAERTNAAVLKIVVMDARNCREWRSFQEFGIELHRAEWSGIGVGIK